MAGGKLLEVGEMLSLSSQHMNVYFQNRQWAAECVALPDREFHNLADWLPYYEEQAKILRVPTHRSPEVVKHFPQLPTHVNWLQVTDALMFENGEWWPRLFLYDSLKALVVREFRDLDISLYSYVIGASPSARVAAAALASLGYAKIILVDEDEAALQAEVKLLRRYLFGIEITAMPAQSLTVQEKPGSLMLNTIDMQDNSTVLGDLSYFNFMKTGGVVVDISECSLHNQLLEEAQRADLKTLSGLYVQCFRDVALLQKLFPQHYITFEDYFESFSDVLPTLKNPSSV